MTQTHASTAPSPRRDGASTLDEAEVERFARLAERWWDPHGEFKPLHKLGPARMQFIREAVVRHFQRPANALKALAGLSVLDVGCGGGLVSEPLARLGGKVRGIDPAQENIEAARRHAESQGLAIDYRAIRIEDVEQAGETFDVVVCVEVVEHVPDVAAFLKSCAAAVRPGGLIILSTINRTTKSWALAIVGAEYILRWLPPGTHQWDRFVTPGELSRHLADAGLEPPQVGGIVYDPLRDAWHASSDTDVNYMAAAPKRP